MKKILALLLAALMTGMTFTACSKKDDDDEGSSKKGDILFGDFVEVDIVGEWTLSDVEISEDAAKEFGMSAKDAEEFIKGIYSLASYNFKEDGKLVIVALGQETPSGEWKLDGNKVVTDDGTFEIKGKTLVLEEDGAKIVFKKK